METLSVVSGLA